MVGYIKKVVPRKGDVDRNYQMLTKEPELDESSPARGTWIEIPNE